MSILFPDAAAKRAVPGRLPGRFPFASWSAGELMVPEEALAVEGVSIAVERPASDERNVRRFDLLLRLRFNDPSEAK